MPKQGAKLEFEGSLKKLEEIVQTLERGELGLEDSIEKFESGVKHYKDCKKLLDKAEKKISVLTDSLNEEPFE